MSTVARTPRGSFPACSTKPANTCSPCRKAARPPTRASGATTSGSWPASAAWKSEFIRARAREALSEMDWSPHHATRTRMEEGVWWAMRLALFLAALLGLAIGILLLLPALAAQAKAGFLSAQNAVQKLERAGSDLARASEARALRRIVDEAAEARGAKDSGAASQSRPSRRL